MKSRAYSPSHDRIITPNASSEHFKKTLHPCANTMQRISPIKMAWPKSRVLLACANARPQTHWTSLCRVNCIRIHSIYQCNEHTGITHADFAAKAYWQVSPIVCSRMSHVVLMKREKDTVGVWALQSWKHAKTWILNLPQSSSEVFLQHRMLTSQRWSTISSAIVQWRRVQMY